MKKINENQKIWLQQLLNDEIKRINKVIFQEELHYKGSQTIEKKNHYQERINEYADYVSVLRNLKSEINSD